MIIQNIVSNFAQKATKEGKKFTSIPLKNSEVASILYNKNSVDCYITQGQKIVEARGAAGPIKHVSVEMYKILKGLSSVVENAEEFKNTTVINIIKNFFS